ncbi:MAG: hypothetical protein ACOY0T_37220 [Myxococcota bacterium]
MNRHVLAALCASGLMCALSVQPEERTLRVGVASALAAEDLSGCLRFEKTQTGKSIDLEARSSCDSRLECSLAYSVRCEDREGKATAHSDHSVRFSVDAGKSETISLSAEPCKQGWTIDNVHWSCRGPTAR